MFPSPAILAAVAALALAPAAQARPKPNPAAGALTAAEQPLVGTWRLGQDGEGAQTCAIYLRSPAVIGGHQVKTAKICVDAVDRAGDLYAWYVSTKGELILADPLRQPVYRFHRLNGGAWATQGDDFGRLLLQPASQVGTSR